MAAALLVAVSMLVTVFFFVPMAVSIVVPGGGCDR
jgi:hypothetical protein